MTITDREIASQPDVWRAAIDRVRDWGPVLAAPGERVLMLGCGTSAFVADSMARLREAAGLGETDAAVASEMLAGRRYDRVVCLTRSGTTSEVLDALRSVDDSTTRVAVTAQSGTPVESAVDQTLVLDFADEESIVQTRFPTATLALALAAFGGDVENLPAAGAAAVSSPLPTDPSRARHFVFLGHGWTVGLAHEAALKIREAAQAWAESYPMLDYRHGPIAVADGQTVIWVFGPAPADLLEDVGRTGATVVTSDVHPLAQLVQAQRMAVALAAARGLDPDRPRRLSRSVVLSGGNPPSGSTLLGSAS